VSEQAPVNPALSAESFGGNEWLIEEQFAKYKKDASLVAPEWRDFFADYRPSEAVNGASADSPAESVRAAAPASDGAGATNTTGRTDVSGKQAKAEEAAAAPAPEPAPVEAEAHSPDSVQASDSRRARSELPPKAPEVTAVEA